MSHDSHIRFAKDKTVTTSLEAEKAKLADEADRLRQRVAVLQVL